MGHSPKAILAYGYDLGQIADHFEWEYDGDEESGGPVWFDRGNDGDFAPAAMRALRAAAGVTPAQYEAMGYVGREAAAAELGVELVRHGGHEGDETLIIAAVVHHTDWEQAVALDAGDLVPADGAVERLRWALEVLGITPAAPAPGWLLAADYG